MADQTMWDMELQAQQDALDERKQMLRAQAARAAQQLGIYAPGGGIDIQQPEGFQSAVTGAKVLAPMIKRPLLGDLTPILADTMLASQRSQLASDQSDYAAREQAAQQAALRRFPQGTPAQAATPDSYGPSGGDADSTLITRTPGTPAIPAQPATAQDRLNWAAQAGNIPSLRDTVRALVTDQTVQQPVRTEQRAYESGEKALDRSAQLTLEERKAAREAARAIATNQTTIEAAKIRAGNKAEPGTWHEMGPASDGSGNSVWYNPSLPQGENQRVGPAGKPPTATKAAYHETATPDPDKPGNVIWQDPASGEQVSRLPSKAEKPARPLPPAQATAYRNNAAALNNVNTALYALDTPEGKDATGWFKGAIAGIPGVGDKMVNWFDSSGTATRALVADIGSLKVHDRSGAAVTAAEEPRLRPFVPSVGDAPNVVKDKLANFKRQYEFIQQQIEDDAAQGGYIVPTTRAFVPPPSRTASGPVTDKPVISDANRARITASSVKATPDQQSVLDEWSAAPNDNRKALAEQRLVSLGYKGLLPNGKMPMSAPEAPAGNQSKYRILKVR